MSPRSADAVLNESFLEIRAKLLEVAAALDRVDRAGLVEPLSATMIERRSKIGRGIELLLEEDSNRAEMLQQLFSREYTPDWRATMKV